MRLLVPDAGHLSQVMAQSTGPAFILGAVAGFTSILLGRMTNVLDRIRSLNEIAEDDTARAHLKSDIPQAAQEAAESSSLGWSCDRHHEKEPPPTGKGGG